MSVSTKTMFQYTDTADVNDIHSLSSDTNTNSINTSNISPQQIFNNWLNDNYTNNERFIIPFQQKQYQPLPFSLPLFDNFNSKPILKSNVLNIENNNIIKSDNYLYGNCNNVPESSI
eukprot:901625_1